MYFYTHDGGGSDRIAVLDLVWASPDASKACTYDKAAEQMTLRMRLHAQTCGPMDVIATGIVARHDDGDGEPEEYTGKTQVTVEGTQGQTLAVTVDVPADAYARGYDDCRLSLDYNRGEPWD